MADPTREDESEEIIEWDDLFPWQIRVANFLIRSLEKPKWSAI
jgi:hypothetical protein